MGTTKMPAPIQPKKANGKHHKTWWIRKKVPFKLRAVVGKTEIWRSLRTEDERKANERIGSVSAKIEAEWKRAAAGAGLHENSVTGTQAPPLAPLHRDLVAVAGAAYRQIFEAKSDHPGSPFRWVSALASLSDDDPERDRFLEEAARDCLIEENASADDITVARFLPHFVAAHANAYRDLELAARGDYGQAAKSKYPERTTPKLDLVAFFEEFAAKGGLKGGVHGPTAKRWRPKIKMFTDWLGHRDLTRMTTTDGYGWVDNLTGKGFAIKSIRDVWIASLSATAGFAVQRRRVPINVFRGITVREVIDEGKDAEPQPQKQKGFILSQAEAILTATLATPSQLISEEMAAARRWLPWLCAYSGARVNELTSLYPADVAPDKETKIWCMTIKPSLEKTANWRTVPIHSHVIQQGFLKYVEKRRRAKLPLFYDPARSRGGKSGNPQFKKVAERIAEWVHGLGIDNVAPNHGWRHRFKSVARQVEMDREVEGFITGHRPKKAGSSPDYGDRWVKTMAKEIEKYPRYRIKALSRPQAPHKRSRRTREQIATDEAAKATRKVARATRAAPLTANK
jgi:hypothetical protein